MRDLAYLNELIFYGKMSSTISTIFCFCGTAIRSGHNDITATSGGNPGCLFPKSIFISQSSLLAIINVTGTGKILLRRGAPAFANVTVPHSVFFHFTLATAKLKLSLSYHVAKYTFPHPGLWDNQQLHAWLLLDQTNKEHRNYHSEQTISASLLGQEAYSKGYRRIILTSLRTIHIRMLSTVASIGGIQLSPTNVQSCCIWFINPKHELEHSHYLRGE